MTILLILGFTAFALGLGIFLLYENEGIQAFGFFMAIIGFLILIALGIKTYKYPLIDLPVEVDQITRDTNNPDTLLGYYKNDTLYIEFTGKHRDTTDQKK